MRVLLPPLEAAEARGWNPVEPVSPAQDMLFTSGGRVRLLGERDN